MPEILSYKNVGTPHPEYNKYADSWRLIEDCIAGEKTIKDEEEKYLPRPSGMLYDLDGNASYKSYITRAHFPDFTSKFLSGLTGVTKINPPKIKLPKKLEYLLEDADGEGTPFDVFFFQSVRMALKTGRYLIFVDVDEEKNRLKLVRYSAKELINWGVVKKVYNEKNADFYVLKEQVNVSDDIFSHEYEDQFRVLSTSKILSKYPEQDQNNEFVSAVFDKNGLLKGSIAHPSLMGKSFNSLPVVIVGSTDIGMEMDQIPLLGVSKCALQMYLKDADLSNAMFLTCNPTLILSGVSTEENKNVKVLVGSNMSIMLEQAEARAYYTQTDASGLQEVRLSIKTYLEEAKHAGSALLSGDQKGVESGEALRIKSAATTASLSTVSQSTARGFEKAIRYMAEWTNLDKESVSVAVDTDYLDNMLTPEYIKELINLFEVNVLTQETVINKLVEGKFLDEDFNIKKELKETKEKQDKKELKEKELAKKNEDTEEDPVIQGTSGFNNKEIEQEKEYSTK